jgi:hypothetical protein
LLKLNKNTLQPISYIRRLLAKQRSIRLSLIFRSMRSVINSPNELSAADLCRVCTEHVVWANLSVLIDCYTLKILCWNPFRRQIRTRQSWPWNKQFSTDMPSLEWSDAVSAKERQRLGVHKPKFHTAS